MSGVFQCFVGAKSFIIASIIRHYLYLLLRFANILSKSDYV